MESCPLGVPKSVTRWLESVIAVQILAYTHSQLARAIPGGRQADRGCKRRSNGEARDHRAKVRSASEPSQPLRLFVPQPFLTAKVRCVGYAGVFNFFDASDECVGNFDSPAPI